MNELDCQQKKVKITALLPAFLACTAKNLAHPAFSPLCPLRPTAFSVYSGDLPTEVSVSPHGHINNLSNQHIKHQKVCIYYLVRSVYDKLST
jgi:hypothetical protein